MVSTILSILFAAVWVLAAIFLAVAPPSELETLRIASAVTVGVPGAIRFTQEVKELIGTLDGTTSARVTRSLETVLVKLYRDGAYSDDMTEVGLHVWVVPIWYRRIIPRALRKRSVPDRRRLPAFLRPRLKRLAACRWEYQPRAGISFPMGVGVVGRSIDLNDPDKAIRVVLDSNEFGAALQSDSAWGDSAVTITQNLKKRDAEQLAKSYGQVAAVAIRGKAGESIGCLTLDLPPGCKFRLKSSPGHTEVLKVIRDAARQIEIHLTGRSV